MKKTFLLLFTSLILILGLGSITAQKASAATAIWSNTKTAPGYGAVYISTFGNVYYGTSGAATFDGVGSINTPGGLQGYTVQKVTISGKGVGGEYTRGGYRSTQVLFNPATAYNISVTSADTQRVLVTTPFKGKVTMFGLPESLQIWAYGYVKVNDGYEANWTSYENAL